MRCPPSDGQNPTWECDHLTPAIADPPPRVRDRQAPDQGTGRVRRSSAIGTDDHYCHIFAGQAPYRYTSCGLRLNPPIPVERTHRAPPCPNGHQPCPECVRVRSEDS